MDALEAIEHDLDRLADDGFCVDPVDLARKAVQLLTPPENISTTECARQFRYFPAPEGHGKIPWNPDLTPYICDIQDILDLPENELVVVIKPGRVGGTVAPENHLFKRVKFGPLTDTLWYLASESEVDAYVDNVVAPMFAMHEDLSARVGTGRSDNKRTFKKISGRKLEYLPINPKTITNRQAAFIVIDELDSARPRLRGTMVANAKVRGRTLGSRRKVYICSHPDAGWGSGVGAAYRETTKSLWYWPCPHCGGFSSPCPTAKWRTILDFERLQGVSDDRYLEHVEKSAALFCPHCGAAIRDAAKPEMLRNRRLVFDGQQIDRDGNVTGEPRSMTAVGLWIHGTMSPFVRFGELARELEAAKLIRLRTRKTERLREVTAKVIGEPYGGDQENAEALTPEALEKRAEKGFALGTAPAEVMFITAAVDVGHGKFDISIYGWDLEGRSWLIDRITLKQRRWADGVLRDLRPAERTEDWMILRDQLLDRFIPLADDPGMALPIAGVAIDTGDGHVTEKAREFARRMSRAGYQWGKGDKAWERVRLIKGARTKGAPELPAKASRKVNVDEEGKSVSPTVLEWDLGVWKLKDLAVERLGVTDGGPGQCAFANGLPATTFAEFTGETLVDGEWVRTGPNEGLDLFGYNDAVRRMLKPERADIRWDTKRPVWARPVPLTVKGGDPAVAGPGGANAAPNKPRSIFERFDALNREQEER